MASRNMIVCIVVSTVQVIIALFAVLLAMNARINSLLDTANDMARCQEAGMQCQIERDTDGTYSVYGVDNFQ